MEQQMKRYMASIARRLNMPKDVKERVMNDFQSSIQGRREAGQTDEEIFAELGTPKKVAAELNEQMKDYTYIKSPWRWVCLVVLIGCILSLIFGGTLGLLMHLLNASLADNVGIIGGADGPTAIFITTSPDYREYVWYQAGITVLILVMSVLGFWRLRRCPKK
jgi:hypothetical protein